MKYYFSIIAILMLLAMLLAGCSSNPPGNSTTAVANQTANSAQANANAVAASNANPPVGLQPYNGIQNVNPNAFNATNDNLKVIPYQPKKDELPNGARNAPDDSFIITGSRGKDFVETRTFRSDALIAKVEKILDGKTTKYKVYLRSGKVFDAPAEKMSNFAAMAPASILDAVGQLPKPPANPQAKPEDKEKQN